MQRLLTVHSHAVPGLELCELLGTDPDHGLDRFEIDERRSRFGSNRLSQRKAQPAVLRFLLQFHQPLIYILIVATLVTLALREWVDAGVIFAVILVNAIVGFVQESKALSAIASLAADLQSQATVIRAGQKLRVSAEELVPGDLVALQSGDRVPADLRLLRVRDLQVDESTLTGESVPAAKAAGELPETTALADRENMAYASTLATYGVAQGVVVAIGDNTEVGRISELIATADVLDTPLTLKIKSFSHVLVYVILGLALFTFLVGLARGNSLVDTFMAAVALAVGAIPEGLPAAVTIMLAIGVSRMARRRAIVRRLPAVETLGSTTVVCSDKTGTLTQNQMAVQELWVGGRVYSVQGVGYDPEGGIELAGDPVGLGDHPGLEELLRCGVLCNDSVLEQRDERWSVAGDPTEGALLVAGRRGGLSESSLAAELPRIDSVPFESEHQYMATLHRSPDGGGVVYVKGSLESLEPRLGAALEPDGSEGELDLAALTQAVESMAAKGQRVLVFARKRLPAEQRGLGHGDLRGDLTLLGTQAMMDPPRPEAARAVATCQRAGIRVKMITGDHAVTAKAVAADLGMTDRDAPSPVLTGVEMEKLDDEALVAAAEEVDVFARVSPEQKLRLVRALQARGQVVAMTGDGVNDAPALRRADIGIAMALGGTEVAREAADMVLTDDNFATIEAAVEEGRAVFDNLRKFIVWTLPTNGGEGLVLLLAVLLGTPLPILPVQILWINMTTAVLLGLMLAFEPKERGIMDRAPQPKDASLFTGALLTRIVLVSAMLCGGAFGVFEWMLETHHAGEAAARTAATSVFVVGEMFYLLTSRSLTEPLWRVGWLSNPWIWLGIGTMGVLQVAFAQAPFMNSAFHTVPLDGTYWLAVVSIGVIIFVVVEVEKRLRRGLVPAGAR